MLKRIVALISAVALAFCVAPSAVFAEDVPEFPITGGVSQRLEQIRGEYPDGSFFTASGASCAHGKYSKCNNCALWGARPETLGTLISAWQCVGFARYVYYAVFGADDYGIDSWGVQVSYRDAKPGDLVRTASHDAIFLFESDGKYYLYEANNTNLINEVTFATIPRSEKQISQATILRAPNYDEVDAALLWPLDGVPASEEESGLASVSVTEGPAAPYAAPGDDLSFYAKIGVLGNVSAGTTVEELVDQVAFLNGEISIVCCDGETPCSADYVVGGSVLRIGEGDTLEEYVIAVNSDVDSDGEITASDARVALRGSIDLEELEPWQVVSVMRDPEGEVTAGEARAILRECLDLEP